MTGSEKLYGSVSTAGCILFEVTKENNTSGEGEGVVHVNSLITFIL